MKDKFRTLEVETRDAFNTTKRIERAKAISDKEIQFLRDQLKSYDLEETTMMRGNFDMQKKERIEQLELLIDEYKTQIAELIEKVSEKQSLPNTSLSEPRSATLFSPTVTSKIRELEERKS